MMPDPRKLAELIVDEQVGPRIAAAGNPPGLASATVELATEALTTHAIDQTQEQLRLLRRTSNCQPDAYLACDGAVEDAAQRAAAGIRTALARVGRLVDPHEFERDLDIDLRDDPELAVRAELARIPRPLARPTALAWSLPPAPWAGDRDRDGDKWPPPDAVAAKDLRSLPGGADALVRVGDGPHVGWVQIALIEVHHTPPHRYPHQPARHVRLAVGLEAATELPSPGSLPFAGAKWSVWTVPWRHLAPSSNPQTVRELLASGKFPLTAITNGSGSERNHPSTGLGLPTYVLGPILPVIVFLDLRPTDGTCGFSLSDDAGPAIVARHWRGHLVHDGGYEPLFPAIDGADLLIRPDRFDELRRHVQDGRLQVRVAVDVGTGEEPDEDDA